MEANKRKSKYNHKGKAYSTALLWKQAILGPLFQSPNAKEKQTMPGCNKSLPIKEEKKAKPFTCP